MRFARILAASWLGFVISPTVVLAAQPELPPFLTTAEADLSFELDRTTLTGAPARLTQAAPTANPYYGNLGEPANFPNIASAAAGASGGPLSTPRPFAFASSVSAAPMMNSGATLQLSFEVSSAQQTSVLVDMNAVVAQTVGYQLIGLNADPTIFYGPFGENAESVANISIQAFALNVPILNFTKQCGTQIVDCTNDEGDLTTWNNQFSAVTNQLYYVTLSTSAFAFSRGLSGDDDISTFASSYIDPYFALDPSVSNPGDFSFAFSDGVQNVPFSSGVPEPGEWALMALGFGAAAAALRGRRARWAQP
jgi:hypothetical protein